MELIAAVPGQRASQGNGEFANMGLKAATTASVSLLGTLISMAKRE
jgi:hypothetical protein